METTLKHVNLSNLFSIFAACNAAQSFGFYTYFSHFKNSLKSKNKEKLLEKFYNRYYILKRTKVQSHSRET